ncbi:MAG: hypothetical protein HY350_04500 [Candidatus Omnitrophica bacterium]|nr:hypothetical protein [Candidatus Omnitrophota bacterium]
MKPDDFAIKLSQRERFRRAMHFQKVDYVPHIEFGYWDSLKDAWYDEGNLPETFHDANGNLRQTRDKDGNIPDEVVETYFGCSQLCHQGPRIETGPYRQIELVEEKGGKRILKDGLGVLYEEIREGDHSIPHYLEFPIKDRKTWEIFRDEFLKIDDKWRDISKDELNKLITDSRSSDIPLGIWFGSFVGWIRSWMGFENFACMTADSPELLDEMVSHLVKISLPRLAILLENIEYDFGAGWEDICFNSGPILNPATFRRVVLPHMKKVIQLLRQHGVDIIWTDCDGNVSTLVPVWLEAGINCLFPAEVKADNDVSFLRNEYGRNLLIRGGFDKLVLLESKDAILKELKRLEPFVAEGGFIPHIDHRCPGGVAFGMYQYYIWEKCHMLGMPEGEIRRIPALQKYSGA